MNPVAACPVGIVLPLDRDQDAKGAVAVAVAAERAGLHSVCCGELASYDSMALLGAVAQATDRIALDSTVVSVLSRSSALIAMAASTLADLSGGRYRLGLGVGSTTIGAWHDRPLRQPLAAMRTALLEVRAALDGFPVDRLGSFKLLSPPRRVTIRVAALNPKMLALAGELADGVILTFAGPEQVGEMSATARRSAEQASRPSPAIVATCWLSTGQDIDEGRRAVREAVAPYFGVATYGRLARALAGDAAVARVVEALESRGRRAAAAVIPDEVVDAIAVVGGPSEVAARVAAYQAAGATEVHFIPLRRGSSGESVHEAVEVLGALEMSDAVAGGHP